jgi:hypothetical protein
MQNWKLFRRVIGLLAIAWLMHCPGSPPASAQKHTGDQTRLASTLDGTTFKGVFTPVDKSSGRPDQFIFKNGTFHSRECLALGFAPGPYSLQLKDGRPYFRSELSSKENGVMIYEGYVTKEGIDARIKWVKSRWYWTMRREFAFKGTQSDGGIDARQ